MINRINKFIIAFLVFFFQYSINYSISYSFSLEEISDGVFVHYGIHEDANPSNKGDIANIGFIVGSKSILVIDTGGTKSIGENLLKKIREISELPISHIVITHSHPDHFFGTEAFLKENPKIIGHERLNRALISNFNFYKDLQYNSIGDEEIKKSKLVKADLEVKINKILKIDLGERVIEIKSWNSGHTDNDLSVYDKKNKIFWSENIFVKRTPSIRASVKGWKKNLEEIMQMDIDIIVPGHGLAKGKEKAIRPLLQYFNRLIYQIRKL